MSQDTTNMSTSITSKIQQSIPLSPEEKNFLMTNQEIPDNEKNLILSLDKRNRDEPLSDDEKAVVTNYDQRVKQQSKDNSKLANIQKKLQGGGMLSRDELNFINNNSNLPDDVKENFLDANEQNSKQLPISVESRENFDRFRRERPDSAFEIMHLSDIHGTSDDFENVLIKNMNQAGHVFGYDENGILQFNNNVPIAITGDLGTDFFDQQNHGLETYLADNIIDKAQFDESEASEFKKHYNELMKLAGIDENMIKERNPFAFQGDGMNAPFNNFLYGYIFGMQDPRFLTRDELKSFRKSQKVVQGLLKKGMRTHSRNELTQIRDNVLKKYNLNPAIVWGNHDIPDVVEEVLGEYLVKQGEVKEVNGLKFGNFVASANGNFTNGPDFNDMFGYAGWKEDMEKQRFESKPFVKLKNTLEEQGLFFEDREIKKYMDISTQRAAQGIGTGALGLLEKNHIDPFLKDKVINNVKDLKKNIPKGADVIIGHSMLDDPQESGIEERAAHRLLTEEFKGEDIIYLHGHKHGFTTHRTENINYLNNGSSSEGNASLHLFDKNKKYLSSLYTSQGANKESVYRHIKANEVPGRSSQKYAA